MEPLRLSDLEHVQQRDMQCDVGQVDGDDTTLVPARTNLGRSSAGLSQDAKMRSPSKSPVIGASGVDVKECNVGPAGLPNEMNNQMSRSRIPASQNVGTGHLHSPRKRNSASGTGEVNSGLNHPGSNQLGGNGTAPLSAHFDHCHGMDKAWASFERDNQGLLTNEPKEWAHFTDSSSKQDTSSISSEAESVEDIWSITDEQRDYYINQFKTMQPNVRGVVSGAVAKEFFEKSRLPVAELSKIWQLSDVNRDGVLSLEEFCTAMHLVVLRRNEIELPDHLPPALIPYVPLNTDETFGADLPAGSTLKKISPPPTASPPHSQPVGGYHGYTRGQDSPTSSSVSSPGSKPTPVNFDYKPIIADEDPKIVHPVALRMSPDGHAVMHDGPDAEVMDSEKCINDDEHRTMSGDMSHPHDPMPTFSAGPHGPGQIRPRPTPKKSMSVPGPAADFMVNQPRLLPRSSPDDFAASGERSITLPVGAVAADIGPLPSPKSGHARSSSLDNQLIDFSDHKNDRLNQTMPPPVVPPRLGHNEGVTFADGVDVVQNDPNLPGTPPARDNRPKSGEDMEPYTSTPAKYYSSYVNTEMRDLKESVRSQRLKNMALCRVNNELNQELQEVMEQRIALEIQLEHLRPFHS